MALSSSATRCSALRIRQKTGPRGPAQGGSRKSCLPVGVVRGRRTASRALRLAEVDGTERVSARQRADLLGGGVTGAGNLRRCLRPEAFLAHALASASGIGG